LRNQEELKEAKGNQALIAIDKCLTTTLNMEVRILENIYEMLNESKITVWC
jgi:hypothetical protein